MNDNVEVAELTDFDEVQSESNVIELSHFLDEFGKGLIDSVSK